NTAASTPPPVSTPAPAPAPGPAPAPLHEGAPSNATTPAPLATGPAPDLQCPPYAPWGPVEEVLPDISGVLTPKEVHYVSLDESEAQRAIHSIRIIPVVQ